MAGYKIEMLGARELRRELKKAGAQFPGELRLVNFAIAKDVASAGRAIAARTPRPHAARPRPDRQHYADFLNSYRPLASQTRAQVAVGDERRRDQWFTGANFGTTGKYPQFPRRRHPDNGLYAGIEQERPAIIGKYGDMLQRLTVKAFPD